MKNKCVGLDCEMCGNTKCPNEEKEKIINGIDVSECPCKDDDKCLEVPILNEYGDLIDYQDCEPQTLCPYRSKTKIQRLQEENEELKEKLSDAEAIMITHRIVKEQYKQALEEIRGMCKRQDFNQGMRTFEILKLINEVLNDRD